MRAGGKNPTGFEYATTSGEAGCARPALPPEGAARTRKWHSGKPPREAEALHPLRIRVARLPRPGRWERRPDLLIPCQHTNALPGADLCLAPATRMKDATCRAPPAPTSVQNLHSHCTSLPAAPPAPGRHTTASAASPTCLTSNSFVAAPRSQEELPILKTEVPRYNSQIGTQYWH